MTQQQTSQTQVYLMTVIMTYELLENLNVMGPLLML